MTFTTWTKSEIFKAAHRDAKNYEGSYNACFALALKEKYRWIKSVQKAEEKEFFLEENKIKDVKIWDKGDFSRVYFSIKVSNYSSVSFYMNRFTSEFINVKSNKIVTNEISNEVKSFFIENYSQKQITRFLVDTTIQEVDYDDDFAA